jgi:membrane protease YdiL (CAAX protease family)
VSPGAALWLRIAAITALSVTLLVALAPARPPARLPWPIALALGAGVGLLLFNAITRSRPRLSRASGSAPVAAAKLGFLGLWAANEEILWRRVALGELLRVGAVPALVASTVGFALMHRARRGVHLGTGGAFGAVYLSTGALVACVAAHWTYNALVGSFLEGTRPMETG